MLWASVNTLKNKKKTKFKSEIQVKIFIQILIAEFSPHAIDWL